MKVFIIFFSFFMLISCNEKVYTDDRDEEQQDAVSVSDKDISGSDDSEGRIDEFEDITAWDEDGSVELYENEIRESGDTSFDSDSSFEDDMNSDIDFVPGFEEGAQYFPIISTGQEFCFHNADDLAVCPPEGSDFHGQDGSYGVYLRVFSTDKTNPAEPVTVDQIRGFRWAPGTIKDNINFKDANNHCKNLVYGGIDSWEVPAIHELSTLAVYNTEDNYFDKSVMEGGSEETFWSATLDITSATSNLWTFDFEYVDIDKKSSSFSASVICISRQDESVPSTNDNRYFTKIMSDGKTVAGDRVTELMWQLECLEDVSWQEGLALCEGLEYGAFDDWRVPDFNELLSVVDYKKQKPAAEINFGVDYQIWSSTSNVVFPGSAFFLYSENGKVDSYGKLSEKTVCCVRNIK